MHRSPLQRRAAAAFCGAHRLSTAAAAPARGSAGYYTDSLHDAARNGSVPQVERLLALHDVAAPDADGNTALFLAGSADVKRVLLAHCAKVGGAAVNAPGWALGYAPLHYAVSGGLDDIAALLLEAGADAAAVAYGDTALHLACGDFSVERTATVALLLPFIAPAGALDARDFNGRTALDVARQHGRDAVADAILAAGASGGAFA
jgi:protein DGCR14